MAGKTYVTRGYSTYTDTPARPGGYDHGQKKPVNKYVVETTKIERIPTPGYTTDFAGSPSKIELLKEFVHAPNMQTKPKHASTDNYEGYEPNFGVNYENSSLPNYHGRDAVKKVHGESSWPMKTSNNFSGPNKHRPSSPVHNYPSEEGHQIRTGLDKYHPSEGARHVSTGNFSGPNKSWQSAGPPATRHPLTTPTNNISEALGFLEDTVRSDPRRRGVLDDLSTRTQPVEPERRYARPAFVAKSNEGRYKTGSTIDSQEAMSRYRGSLVP